MTQARFRELDGLRGLAALAVVLSHLTFGYDAKYEAEPDYPVQVWWGGYGVQLFFMISGFVILMSARRVRRSSDFVVSRLSRLYPAYWIALVLATVWSLAFAIPRTGISWSDRLLNVVMVQRWFDVPNVDEVYWTLAIEMQFYVLVWLLLLVTRARLTDRVVTGAALAWLVVSIAVAVVAAPHSHGVGPQFVATPWKVLINATLAEWGPLFVAGMFAHLARSTAHAPRTGPPRTPASTYWLLAWTAGGVAILNAGLLTSWPHAGAVAVVVSMFLLVVHRRTTGLLTHRSIQWLGRISYSLYIVHNLLAMWVIHHLVPVTGRTAAMVVALVVVLLASRGVHELGEVRGTALLRRVLERLRTRDHQPVDLR